MEQEKLNEIIADHNKWLKNEGGKRADLAGADLHGADLDGANLRGADLDGANLRGANLYGASLYRADLCGADLRGADLYGASLYRADLRGADLCGADLSGADLYGASLYRADLRGADLSHADLRHANLRGTNLRGTNLEGANLPVGMYQIVGPGSCNRCTTYDVINDQIVCGCWNDGKGNHLDSFIKRIEVVYGINGESPNQTYYAEYMAGISFFRAMKELDKKVMTDREKRQSEMR